MRVALAATLFTTLDLLLIDEPSEGEYQSLERHSDLGEPCCSRPHAAGVAPGIAFRTCIGVKFGAGYTAG